jgi:chromosome segregation ATPase
MSDTQLDRIEGTLGRIDSSLQEVKADVAVLKTDVAGLKTDVAGLKTDVTGLKGDVARLDGKVEELRVHMGVLHEDALDRIAALNASRDEGRLATKADLADLREHLDQRLNPIEMAIRSHSADIADLQRWREAH